MRKSSGIMVQKLINFKKITESKNGPVKDYQEIQYYQEAAN